MDTIETTIDGAIATLNKLYGLPAIALVALSCIVVGYILRCIKRFPNDGIPIAVILWGAAFLPLLSDYTPGKFRIWLVRNVFVGLITGFVAWLFHNKILSKIEDKLGLFNNSTVDPTTATTDKP